MNICSLNFGSVNFNKINFVHQNPINFKGNQKEDSVELSDEARAQKTIKRLEEDIQYLIKQKNMQEERKAEIAKDVMTLSLLLDNTSFTDEELQSISNVSIKRKMKNVNPLANELNRIFSSKLENYELSDKTLDQLSARIKDEIRNKSFFCSSNEEYTQIIKKEIEGLIKSLCADSKLLDIRIEDYEHSITRTEKQIKNVEYFPNFAILYDDANYAKARGRLRIKLAQELGCIIDLDDHKYSNLSPDTKRALRPQLEKLQIEWSPWPINSQQNQEYLAQFENFEIFSTRELESFFKIDDINGVFPNTETKTISSRELVLFPKDDDYTKAILDLAYEKVKTKGMLSKENHFDVEQLPFVFEKYDTEDKDAKINFTFINPNNKLNNLIINGGQKFKQYLSQMPFEYDEKPWGMVLDLESPKNQQLFKNIHPLYPEKSDYAYGQLCADKSETTEIPVEHLEKLGFSKANILIDLINNGRLDGKKDENGNYSVAIDTRNHIGKNKNLDVLQMLRKQNPQVKTFTEVSKALGIKRDRLEYAIFSGEVDIIDEYINVADREIRYINIATPKNQEFIRKVKFEQELEKQIKENQREARRQARIEHKDLTSRKQGVRMALVWEFMPNTKAIGSMLAKKDGYVAKLLAKEDDPNETLTNLEEAKINSYRKEMWTLAGTDELKEAYKKAGKIMKAFSENGLSAVDEEYLPIFERYGFTN